VSPDVEKIKHAFPKISKLKETHSQHLLVLAVGECGRNREDCEMQELEIAVIHFFKVRIGPYLLLRLSDDKHRRINPPACLPRGSQQKCVTDPTN
jgi:hypothetical protein